MAIESATFLTQLDETNPKGTDQRSTLDDHTRLTKKTLKNTLRNLDSTVSATPQALNFTIGLSANAQQQINGLHSSIAVTSANLANEIASASSALQASLLGLSDTAVNAILWDGSKKFLQTATPSLGTGDIWFKPE